MVKEVCMKFEEMKSTFPINSMQIFDGKAYKVIGYEKPMNTNCMVSYPMMILEQIKEQYKNEVQ